MTVGESKYYRRWANERGDVTLEQIFPPVSGEPQILEGQEAKDIANAPDTVSVWQTYRHVTNQPNETGQQPTDTFTDHRLEIHGLGRFFIIEGWHQDDDGATLTGLIEDQIGLDGLNIVLERGIIQRNPTAE